MKSYPTIPREVRFGRDWMVYDKLDGQNVRVEWDAKKGFWKYGSRNVLAALPQVCFDLLNEHEETVGKILKKLRLRKATLFFEFYGDRSLAGIHDPTDNMKVALLDVYVIDKKRWMDPRDVEKKFRDKVPMPSLLHRGNFNKEHYEQVRSGKFQGMTFEGVVCKAPPASKGVDVMNQMFKVKNQAWIDAVRERFHDKAEELI